MRMGLKRKCDIKERPRQRLKEDGNNHTLKKELEFD